MALNATASQAHAFLERQRLQPTPPNYHLAYLHVTNGSPTLDAEIARITDGGVRIRQDEAADLVARFGGIAVATAATPAPAAPSAAEKELRAALLRIGQIATDTGKASGDFGAELQSRLGEIERDPSAMTAVVLSMIERASVTERRLASVRGKVDELRQELEAAKGDAYLDSLTNLPNRRAIERHLAEAQGVRSVAICDIDHFKNVNDTFGHQVGDRVLKMVATTIAESCPGHFVARWGGEEFMIVVEGSERQAADVVEHARRSVAGRTLRLRDTDQPLGRITFSAGVSDMEDTASAIAEADKRLYAAKRGGRNQVAMAA